MASRKTPGIVQRHSRKCRTRQAGACNCQPTYEAWVWSQREQTKLRKAFANLAEAKNWRADAIGGVHRGTMAKPSRVTVHEAADAWLEAAKAGEILTRAGRPYKPSALRSYESDLSRYVHPEIGQARLSELRRRDVQELVDHLVGKRLSASKIRNVVNAVRVVVRYELERDTLAINPTANLRLPAVTSTRDRVATPAEAACLLAALPEDDRALWATAFYGGLRRGELRALRVEDVDLAAGVIRVHRGWDDKEGEIDPKSKKGERGVPIPGVLRDYLDEHLLRAGREGVDFMFGSTASAPFTPSNKRKRAAKAWHATNAKRAEEELPPLVPIGLHECRHTYVSLMHEAGFTLERIGDYVGHGSAYMTDKYRHLLDGHETEAARRFGDYLARAATEAVSSAA